MTLSGKDLTNAYNDAQPVANRNWSDDRMQQAIGAAIDALKGVVAAGIITEHQRNIAQARRTIESATQALDEMGVGNA